MSIKESHAIPYKTLKVHLGKLMDYSTDDSCIPTPCSLPPRSSRLTLGVFLQLCNHGSENIDRGGTPSKIDYSVGRMYSVCNMERESTAEYVLRTEYSCTPYSLRTWSRTSRGIFILLTPYQVKLQRTTHCQQLPHHTGCSIDFPLVYARNNSRQVDASASE